MPAQEKPKKQTIKQKLDALIKKYGRNRDIRKVVEVRNSPGLLKAVTAYQKKQKKQLKEADPYMKNVKME